MRDALNIPRGWAATAAFLVRSACRNWCNALQQAERQHNLRHSVMRPVDVSAVSVTLSESSVGTWARVLLK
jgi:uncharacterized protein YbdZ (MbtH family)